MTARTALPANPFPVPERVLPALTRLEEYEIERVLAPSSFAVIYRAYDHALKLHVAIKEYLPDALALRSAEVQVVPRSRAHAERFELGRQAFIGEAQTLARCDHPALLRILRILQRHGTVYRVMRYCPGPTLLAHRRDVAQAPDVATLRLWLDHLLGALQALHEEGCVHGAVAPGNILLGADERPLLLDFDAVRGSLISDRTQSMMAALEPCFAPIEQRQPAAHLALGPWTDLYSLAASLHFCISGQLPTPPASDAPAGFEPLGTLWQRRGLAHAQDAAPLLDALDACLAELPAQRPQSVAQFRALLVSGAVPRAVRPASKPVPQVVAARELEQPVAKATAAPLLPPLPSLPEANAAGTLNARIIADLDQTFAKIAAGAQSAEANAHDSVALAAGLDTTVPMGFNTPAPVARKHAPSSAPRVDDPVAALQALAVDPAMAPAVTRSDAAARHLRRQWLYVGVVLAALATAGAALWWAGMGDAPPSQRAEESSPAAAIDPPPAATASPPGAGALTLPPPSAGKTEPPPAPTPPQAEDTPVAPPVKPAAPPSKDKARPKTTPTRAAVLTSPREAHRA